MNTKKSLFLALLWSISNFSIACDLTIAKIQWHEKLLNNISVLRNGKTHFITEKDRELCRGDQLTVPQQAVPVTIWYYSESPNKEEIIVPTTNYQLRELKEPCGMWCKVEDKIVSLVDKLTKAIKPKTERFTSSSSKGPKPAIILEDDILLTSVATRGNDENKPVFMPLSAGKSKNAPFFLFTNEGKVNLFWHNGKPPFQIILQDNNGNELSRSETKQREWAFIPSTFEVGTIYHLIIKDQLNQSYSSKIEFTVPPLPIDSKADKFTLFATLLQQEKLKGNSKNWRLEIYRQLLALPDSPEKQNFLDHLIADDF